MKKSSLHLITNYKRLLKYFDDGAVFCAVDTEATGIKLYEKNPESPENKILFSRIIEIGAVKFSKNGVLSTFDALINPDEKLSPFIANLTHITDEMLAEKPNFSSTAKTFLDFIGEPASEKESESTEEKIILVAHNAQFDIRFLNAELENCGRDKISNLAVDTLRLSRIVYQDFPSWTLQNLAAKLNIQVKSAHRADDDARVCMELFKRCIKELRIQIQKKRQKNLFLAEEALFGTSAPGGKDNDEIQSL